MSSNIEIYANIVLDDENHRPETRYLPGDVLALFDPTAVDRRRSDRLTARQRREYEEMIPCELCQKPCVGTCVSSSE